LLRTPLCAHDPQPHLLHRAGLQQRVKEFTAIDPTNPYDLSAAISARLVATAAANVSIMW
jgi:hypothetical protein